MSVLIQLIWAQTFVTACNVNTRCEDVDVRFKRKLIWSNWTFETHFDRQYLFAPSSYLFLVFLFNFVNLSQELSNRYGNYLNSKLHSLDFVFLCLNSWTWKFHWTWKHQLICMWMLLRVASTIGASTMSACQCCYCCCFYMEFKRFNWPFIDCPKWIIFGNCRICNCLGD